jgi:hypothetical protein
VVLGFTGYPVRVVTVDDGIQTCTYTVDRNEYLNWLEIIQDVVDRFDRQSVKRGTKMVAHVVLWSSCASMKALLSDRFAMCTSLISLSLVVRLQTTLSRFPLGHSVISVSRRSRKYNDMCSLQQQQQQRVVGSTTLFARSDRRSHTQLCLIDFSLSRATNIDAASFHRPITFFFLSSNYLPIDESVNNGQRRSKQSAANGQFGLRLSCGYFNGKEASR